MSSKDLRKLFDGELGPAGIVIWLDDLERFLGEDGLTVGLLNWQFTFRRFIVPFLIGTFPILLQV